LTAVLVYRKEKNRATVQMVYPKGKTEPQCKWFTIRKQQSHSANGLPQGNNRATVQMVYRKETTEPQYKWFTVRKQQSHSAIGLP